MPIYNSDAERGVATSIDQFLPSDHKARARANISISQPAFFFDPSTKSNGNLASSFSADTGQAMTAFVQTASNPAPLAISSGVIVHTPNASANSAGYMQANLGARVSRIGCTASWPTSAAGILTLIVPSAPWGDGTLPNAGIHLVIAGNGVWTLGRWTGTITTLANNTTHGQWATVWGTGYVSFEVLLDYDNNRVLILWPDGTETVVNSVYLGSETSNYAVWELYESAGSQVSASIGYCWADTEKITSGSRNTKAGRFVPSLSPMNGNSVSGAVTVDWSTTDRQKTILTGNVTSLTFSNPKDRSSLLYLEIQQDSTGNRTVSGINAAIKWAGGAAPTFSTGAFYRDIFLFKHDQGTYFEVSRSIGVR